MIGCFLCVYGWFDGVRDGGMVKEEYLGVFKRVEDARNVFYGRYLRISSWLFIWKDLEDGCGGGEVF